MNGLWRRIVTITREENGATMITMLFFLFCLGGLLALLLLSEQADYLEMKVQHTADLITKGARAAGMWEYANSDGAPEQRLYATTEEAEQENAEVIRGAREEAAILWTMNQSALASRAEEISVVYQKGERSHLYRQGIYHLKMEVDQRIPAFWEQLDVKIERVSQSGVYD